jgi:hypothetical protein
MALAVQNSEILGNYREITRFLGIWIMKFSKKPDHPLIFRILGPKKGSEGQYCPQNVGRQKNGFARKIKKTGQKSIEISIFGQNFTK